MATYVHKGPSRLRLGIVHAQNIDPLCNPASLDSMLEGALEAIPSELTPEADSFRKAVRDVFRNGTFKPTGRSKPASEYLLRAASEDSFPRINTPVDVCNTISLMTLLPISIWDLDRAGSDTFVFRLGMPGETYVFNHSGQEIDIQDLIVGCAASRPDEPGRPIVNAVKDSMATKTHDETRNVAAAIYSPLEEGPFGSLADCCSLFARLLAESSGQAEARTAILAPGESVQL